LPIAGHKRFEFRDPFGKRVERTQLIPENQEAYRPWAVCFL